MSRVLDWVSDFNVRYQMPLIAGFAVFMLIFGIGAFRVQVDSNWLDDFWDSSSIYQTIVRVDDEMGGATNIIYLFDSGSDDGIKEPAVLREIERVQLDADEDGWLVRKSYSIVDIVKDLNQAFHGDDPAYHRIPDTREEVAQYLLLYESSGGEEAEEYVSSDYRHANLELRLRIDRTARTEALVDRLAAGLEEDPLEASEVSLTGIGALWLVLMDYIMSSNIQGFGIAFSVITLMMIGIFRSVRIGMISMIPNLAPVLLAMGAMGWFDVTLDYNKVSIAAIALGISVDDTIHLMTRFHHEFGVHQNYRKALRAALNDVGRALIITSVALVLGFLVLMFSELRSQGLYGILLSGALLTALVADFFFMPALVLWLKPFGPEGKGRSDVGDIEVRAAA
jgi:predicted RND superfamily exporter protein